MLYISLHRYPFYPATDEGGPSYVGSGAGQGYNVNIGWPLGNVNDAAYVDAFERLVMPIANEYLPQLVLISAGFDAAEGAAQHSKSWRYDVVETVSDCVSISISGNPLYC